MRTFPQQIDINVTADNINDANAEVGVYAVAMGSRELVDSMMICPIAKAMRRDYPEFSVEVTDTEIEFTNMRNGFACYPMAEDATTFVRLFDEGEQVEPFTSATEPRGR